MALSGGIANENLLRRQAALMQRSQQVELVLEVPVKGTPRDTGFPRNFFQCGCCHALAAEHFLGGVKNGDAGLFGILLASAHFGSPAFE